MDIVKVPKGVRICMRFLIVDDIKIVLEEECALLREVMPDCQICSCTDSTEALLCAQKDLFHVAFLDIELEDGDMNGILLAKKLKDIQPQIHIIFVTGFTKYAVEAFSIHATGYLLKPVQKEDLKRELTFIYGEEPIAKKRVKVQTFGNFEIWVDDMKLNFRRQKSKELFAYLVERKGAGVTTREACAILFDDGLYNLSRKSYFQNIVSDMRSTLKKAGVAYILCKSYNHLSVNVEKIDCDYYRFLEGDVKVINQYKGEFMTNYSWAEFLVPVLNDYIRNERKTESTGVE